MDYARRTYYWRKLLLNKNDENGDDGDGKDDAGSRRRQDHTATIRTWTTESFARATKTAVFGYVASYWYDDDDATQQTVQECSGNDEGGTGPARFSESLPDAAPSSLSSVAACSGAVLLALIWLVRRRQHLARKRAKYDRWIRRALKERGDKVHHVLDSRGDDNDSDVLVERELAVTTPTSEAGEREKDKGYVADVDGSFSSCSGRNAFMTATETREAVVTGKVDPQENVVVLARRCRRYGRPLNAVAEEFYAEATIRADVLGTYLNDNRSHFAPAAAPAAAEAATAATTSSAFGPLYGIPISVKEHIAMTGSYSTAGMACRLRHRNHKDSLIVECLKGAGAIPLVTGNAMQVLMLPETVNRIWGRAMNPWDTTRTPGGSSGGDAALVAMSCVPLALASDVAGSIRIPASFCGVVGFKPTPARMSSKGIMKPRLNDKNGTRYAAALPNILPCCMCVSTSNTVLMLRVIISAFVH